MRKYWYCQLDSLDSYFLADIESKGGIGGWYEKFRILDFVILSMEIFKSNSILNGNDGNLYENLS